MNKKILIIGNSANAYALAKKLSEANEIFVAPGSDTISDIATCLDIREDSIKELLEYVVENDIDLTIPISQRAINADIANIFTKHNQAIFAPSKAAAKLIFDKASLKKVFYKLRIPTPKFGIFEKQNMVMDYLKNIKPPFVLKTNETSSAVTLTSNTTAKPIVDSFFAQKNQKVIIEEYIWGTPFCFYVLTDGYKALPIGSSLLYKHSLDGDGGQLTNGMGACSPNYKLSLENEYLLMDNVVYPIIEHIESSEEPYIGLLGVNGILTEEGQIQVLGLTHFLNDCDCDAVINLIDSDICKLFESCIIGSFSDEIEFIPQKNISATSLVLKCKNKENFQNSIQGLEQLEDETFISFYPNVTKNKYLEYEVNYGPAIVLTSFGGTTSSATSNVYKEAQEIQFNGIHYRKDICKPQLSAI